MFQIQKLDAEQALAAKAVIFENSNDNYMSKEKKTKIRDIVKDVTIAFIVESHLSRYILFEYEVYYGYFSKSPYYTLTLKSEYERTFLNADLEKIHPSWQELSVEDFMSKLFSGKTTCFLCEPAMKGPSEMDTQIERESSNILKSLQQPVA